MEDYPSYPRTPRVAVITYRPDVAYLLLTMSNGATERVPVVRGAGMVFAAFSVARRPAMVIWGAYNAGRAQGVRRPGSAGQVLLTGSALHVRAVEVDI